MKNLCECGMDMSLTISGKCPICKDGVIYRSLSQQNDCRKEFEKHCEGINFPGSLERYEDDYKSNDTYILWIGFKAGWFAKENFII